MNRHLPSTTTALVAAVTLKPAAQAEPSAPEQASGQASGRIHSIERVGRAAWRLTYRKTSTAQSGLRS